MSPRFVIDPIKSGLDGEPSKKSILCPVPVRCGEIDGSAFVVEGLFGVVEVFVPSFSNSKLNSGPLVHHGDGQRVELLFASLKVTNGYIITTVYLSSY